ncbi:MAG TPA: TylF/MycF/NovP-related O-methyltransferase [Stellaceae bacterium]|nr:TylF/MycF/NovP-related O-methyltransferase [Stellaceae bacterium]
MFRELFYQATSKARFVLPPFLMTLGYMLYRARGAYFQDGLLTVHNSDFRIDRRFREAYQLGKATGSWGRQDVEWRAYICCWAAWSVCSKDGDFVECGVNRGGYSRAVMHYVDFESLDKKFWLLDTYEGLASHLISEDERHLGILPGGYSPCHEYVKKIFDSIPRVNIIKGVVPDTLSQVKSNRVCYISIDMNNAAPEIAAAEYFWDRLISGGIIVLDDYGWRKHINQKIAFDKFADERGVKVLCLPTGQGLIFKP